MKTRLRNTLAGLLVLGMLGTWLFLRLPESAGATPRGAASWNPYDLVGEVKVPPSDPDPTDSTRAVEEYAGYVYL
jgi:hypothetical protein